MNAMITLQLTEKLGAWIIIDLRYWKLEIDSYDTFHEGRCYGVQIGPVNLGCKLPTGERV